MGETDLELESRRRIFQHVVDDPGIHVRGLQEALEYAKGTVQYHLRWLEAEGLVTAESDGQYTRYYPDAEFDSADRQVMNALRRTYARRIVAHLAAEGPLTTAELADRLEKARSTVSWHLSKLTEAALVTKERAGREVRYELTDPDRVTYLYTVHRQAFPDRVVDRLLDLWDSY
jgi:predicted transcriptional regulator